MSGREPGEAWTVGAAWGPDRGGRRRLGACADLCSGRERGCPAVAPGPQRHRSRAPALSARAHRWSAPDGNESASRPPPCTVSPRPKRHDHGSFMLLDSELALYLVYKIRGILSAHGDRSSTDRVQCSWLYPVAERPGWDPWLGAASVTTSRVEIARRRAHVGVTWWQTKRWLVTRRGRWLTS